MLFLFFALICKGCGGALGASAQIPFQRVLAATRVKEQFVHAGACLLQSANCAGQSSVFGLTIEL
jgi:hypothetical protein